MKPALAIILALTYMLGWAQDLSDPMLRKKAVVPDPLSIVRRSIAMAQLRGMHSLADSF